MIAEKIVTAPVIVVMNVLDPDLLVVDAQSLHAPPVIK